MLPPPALSRSTIAPATLFVATLLLRIFVVVVIFLSLVFLRGQRLVVLIFCSSVHIKTREKHRK